MYRVQPSGSVAADVVAGAWFLGPLVMLLGMGEHMAYSIVMTVLLEAAAVGLWLLCHFRCSSPVCSFWQGLGLVGSGWGTGDVRLVAIASLLTVLVAFFGAMVLVVVTLPLGLHKCQVGYVRWCHVLSRGQFDCARAAGALKQVHDASQNGTQRPAYLETEKEKNPYR